MFDVDGLELWERDGYAEAIYEQADLARKAEKENPVSGQTPPAPDGAPKP